MFGELPAAHLPSPQRSSSRRDTRGVRVPDSPTAPRPGQTDTPGGKDSGAKVRSAFGAVAAARAAPAGPQAWQTIAVSLLALPAGRIRRRSLMNQVKHPATGWRNPLICGRRRTSPAPCLAAAHLPVSPRQAAREQRSSEHGRQRLPPPRREAAAADKARVPAAMGVRNAPARPIVWGPLCSSTPRSPTAQAEIVGAGQTRLC